MDFIEKLIEEVKKGKTEADFSALLADMLGDDPCEVLNKKVEKINPLLSGNLLETAAVLFVMEFACKIIRQSDNRLIDTLYNMYKDCFADKMEAFSGTVNKTSGTSSLKIIKANREE